MVKPSVHEVTPFMRELVAQARLDLERNERAAEWWRAQVPHNCSKNHCPQWTPGRFSGRDRGHGHPPACSLSPLGTGR